MLKNPLPNPMYLPSHFTEESLCVQHTLIEANPFGTLVTNMGGALDANHLPFELDRALGDFGTLRAHAARENPLFRGGLSSCEGLVIFRGPDGYVSPSWYPSKHEHHRQVPTWNYEVVHVHGTMRVVEDENFLRGVLARLTRRHEAAEPTPWTMTDAPADFISELLSMVVGIELTITRIEGKRKLNQNKSSQDRAGVMSALRERGNCPLANAMKNADSKIQLPSSE